MRRKLASPISTLLLRRPFSSATTKTNGSILTADELTEVNAVIERLSNSNHFQEAIRLLSVSLPSPPHPLPSSLPFLIHRLSSSSSSSTPSIFFLLSTLLHHNPPPSSPALPFSSRLLVSSLLRHRRLHDAAGVFSWLLRHDSPCRPDAETYRVFLRGLCDERMDRGGGSAVDVLRAAREMVRDGVEVGEEVRGLVWRSLLTEARVEEAREIDAALAAVNGGGGQDGGDIGELMDRIIREWRD